MPFDLTIADGTGRGRRFRFDAGEVTIGRDPGSDLFLFDPSVSRSHARIRAEGPAHLLLDAGSANGTSLNGTPVLGAASLSPGDRIGVGPLIFEFGPRRSAAPWIAAAGAALSWARRCSFPGRAPACALVGAATCLLAVVATFHGREVTALASQPAAPAERGVGAAPVAPPAAASAPTAAQALYERGRRKLEERRVAPRNLYDAWKSFTAARSLLGGRPAPAPLDALPRLIEELERDLRGECKKLLFAARRLERYAEEHRAQAAYREMLLWFPGDDPGGCRAQARQELSEQPDGDGIAR